LRYAALVKGAILCFARKDQCRLGSRCVAFKIRGHCLLYIATLSVKPGNPRKPSCLTRKAGMSVKNM